MRGWKCGLDAPIFKSLVSVSKLLVGCHGRRLKKDSCMSSNRKLWILGRVVLKARLSQLSCWIGWMPHCEHRLWRLWMWFSCVGELHYVTHMYMTAWSDRSVASPLSLKAPRLSDLFLERMCFPRDWNKGVYVQMDQGTPHKTHTHICILTKWRPTLRF